MSPVKIKSMTFTSSFFFFNQKTTYDMLISDWSSDVCSSDLPIAHRGRPDGLVGLRLDVLPVQREADDFRLGDCNHYFSSSGKCLRIDIRGLGAAWPRPQIEA